MPGNYPPQSFENLYLKYRPRLVNYAMHFVNNQDDAQDIVQDSFLALWKYGYADNAESSRILFTIIRNKCLNYLKHAAVKSNYRDLIQKTVKGNELLYNLDFSYDADAGLLYNELETYIQKVLASLSERCREVFISSRFLGMKNKEIAQKLNISVKAVEKHIGKALKAFETALQDGTPSRPVLKVLIQILFPA